MEIKKLEKIQFRGHEFEFIFTSDNKNTAKKEAKKCRKRGFHTRVRELKAETFTVYRRKKS
jgi:hypothetical protein